MVFKAVQDRFKVKSGHKVLKKRLEKLPMPADSPDKTRTIGCIVDLDAFARAEDLYGLRKDFDLAPNAIQIIGYKREYDKVSPFGVQFFCDRDLGWNGEITNGHASEFLGREYDVLINYFQRESLMLKLVSAMTVARIRIGFSEVDTRLNDLILDTPMEDLAAFRSELKKYLTVFGSA